MSETLSASSSPSRAKKRAVRRRSGPTVRQLITQIVASSNERSGVSLAALKKALAASGYDVMRNRARIKVAVKGLVSRGVLVRRKGGSGSLMMGRRIAMRGRRRRRRVGRRVGRKVGRRAGRRVTRRTRRTAKAKRTRRARARRVRVARKSPKRARRGKARKARRTRKKTVRRTKAKRAPARRVGRRRVRRRSAARRK